MNIEVKIKKQIFRLANDKNMSRCDYRVYLYLYGKCNTDKIFSKSQGDIAGALGISRMSVNQAINRLYNKKLIKKIPRPDTYSNVFDYKICG